jgi:hypothetical protein
MRILYNIYESNSKIDIEVFTAEYNLILLSMNVVNERILFSYFPCPWRAANFLCSNRVVNN